MPEEDPRSCTVTRDWQLRSQAFVLGVAGRTAIRNTIHVCRNLGEVNREPPSTRRRALAGIPPQRPHASQWLPTFHGSVYQR